MLVLHDCCEPHHLLSKVESHPLLSVSHCYSIIHTKRTHSQMIEYKNKLSLQSD